MSEFGPRERRLLRLVDKGRAASPDSRARVRARVLAQVAAIGVAATVAESAAAVAGAKSAAAVAGAKSAAAVAGAKSAATVAGAGGGCSSATAGFAGAALKVAMVLGTVAVVGAGAAWWALPGEGAAAASVPHASPLQERRVARSAPSAAVSVAEKVAATKSRPVAADPEAPAAAAGGPIAPARRDASQPPADDIDAELSLLRQAHLELGRGNVSAALAALDRHANEHPRGALAVEREGIRALALCPAQTDAARRWLARYPNLPLARRLRSRCRL